MSSILTVSSVRIEQTEVAIPTENFEVGYDQEFESLLERSERNREAIKEELARNRTELQEARKQLEEGLRSKREDLEAELKKASQRYQELKKEEEEKEEKEKEEAQAESFGAERVHKKTALASLVVAGSGLPAGFRGQIGTSLMASGKGENALNGYLLQGGGLPTTFLKNTLERLGALGQGWNLDKEALSDLENLFIESGVGAEDASNLIAALAQEELTLDNVLRTVNKADLLATQNQGLDGGSLLTATPDGLNGLGQYLASLGLSTEVVKAVTSIAPGQTISSYDLRNILANGSDEILAPLLTEGDLNSLVQALTALGADQKTFSQLNLLLEANQGQANLNDLLGLLAFAETPGPVTPDPAKVAQEIQNLLAQTAQNGELVKEPLFNEIVLKMALLGDRTLSQDFAELSPALQALRGGVAVWRETTNENFDRGGGDQRQSREREERLMAQSGLKSQTLSWGLDKALFGSTLSQEQSGYAGETLAKQISQKLIYSARRGVHRLRMNLDPESLGHLDVELKVKGDKLTANIKAESLAAYEALEKEMSSLKQTLAQAGLELEMTLSYDGDEANPWSMARSGYDNANPNPGQGQAAEGDEAALAAQAETAQSPYEKAQLLDAVV
ncbi:MAG: flagellar hook-length control protein FliK [Deltaproteobacteria bacterium]|jgi:flagellar hook-length control protein FliK|nr:flagellar hook-length control protein FliK [Deltaproteobacteria bacterium]